MCEGHHQWGGHGGHGHGCCCGDACGHGHHGHGPGGWQAEHGGWWQDSPYPFRFHRPSVSREEEICGLERHLEDLEAEVQGVRERLAQLGPTSEEAK